MISNGWTRHLHLGRYNLEGLQEFGGVEVEFEGAVERVEAMVPYRAAVDGGLEFAAVLA